MIGIDAEKALESGELEERLREARQQRKELSEAEICSVLEGKKQLVCRWAVRRSRS